MQISKIKVCMSDWGCIKSRAPKMGRESAYHSQKTVRGLEWLSGRK